MSSFPSIFSGFKKVQGSICTDEFEAWEPKSSYAKKEVIGSPQWTGGEVKAISTKIPLPADPPMAQYFKDLAGRMWQKARPDTSAPRMGPTMGTHRNPMPPLPALPVPTMGGHRQPKMPPLPPKPDPAYRPMPSPVSMDMPIMGAKAQGIKPADIQYLNGVANDWTMMTKLERVNAYTFRGDRRSPDQIKLAAGFSPPSSRTDDAYLKGKVFEFFKKYMQSRWQLDLSAMTADEFLGIVNKTTKGGEAEKIWYQYTIWRAIVQSEELHLGRMLAEETLKGYISTSRAVGVAKGFAGDAGWLYVLRVVGGMVVPEKGKHAWTSIFGEQEIAYPGALAWDAVMGFRQVTNKKFTPQQPLYLRKGFQKEDSKAFEACYDLLSGKPQV